MTTLLPDEPTSTTTTPAHRPRTWGLRFSVVDGIVLLLAVIVTALTYQLTAGLSLLILFVVGHFFLFCNVFRIRRNTELLWAAIFVVNCAAWMFLGNMQIHYAMLCQLPVTVLLIAYELRLPVYHGIFSKRLNPRLDDYLAGKI